MTTRALVQDCTNFLATGSVSLCEGSEDTGSGGFYQTIVSLGGTTIESALANDTRALGHLKCIDPADLTAPTTC